MSPLLSASGLSLEVHCNVYRREISSFTFYLITREATVLLTANFAFRMCRTRCKCSAWVYDRSAQRWELDNTCKFFGLCKRVIDSK